MLGVQSSRVAKVCHKWLRLTVHSFEHYPNHAKEPTLHFYSRHSYRSFQRDTFDPSPFKQQVRIGIGAGARAILNVTTNEQQAEAAKLVTKLEAM